jgi:hypothetical protein
MGLPAKCPFASQVTQILEAPSVSVETSLIQGFEPFEHALPGFCTSPIALIIHVFRVQRMKETFHERIAPAVLSRTHARRQAVTGQQLAVPAGSVLSPTVRMMHHTRRQWVTAMVRAAIAVRRRPQRW